MESYYSEENFSKIQDKDKEKEIKRNSYKRRKFSRNKYKKDKSKLRHRTNWINKKLKVSGFQIILLIMNRSTNFVRIGLGSLFY